MHYRLYALNPEAGIVAGADLDAADDADAIRQAGDAGGDLWELWCGPRRVAQALGDATPGSGGGGRHFEKLDGHRIEPRLFSKQVFPTS